MRKIEEGAWVIDGVNAGRIDNPAQPSSTGSSALSNEKGARKTMASGTDLEEAGTASAPDTGVRHGRAHRHHDGGLLAIGLFKVIEAVFFILVGVGAIHFIHRDLGDAALRLAMRLRIDPDGRLIGWVLDHIDAITAHRLKQIGVATFFYAGLRVTEGVGLVLEKAWAEYLTVGVTIAFLPWEVYEILRRPDWIRVCLLLINLGVLAYLLWWLRRYKAGSHLA
jgi:uncharacterized membrane protein (DUF2068 family)